MPLERQLITEPDHLLRTNKLLRGTTFIAECDRPAQSLKVMAEDLERMLPMFLQAAQVNLHGVKIHRLTQNLNRGPFGLFRQSVTVNLGLLNEMTSPMFVPSTGRRSAASGMAIGRSDNRRSLTQAGDAPDR
jgi:hypothetical protein